MKARARPLLALLALAACNPIERIEEYFYAESPREAYVHRLASAGLTETALVRDFEAAGVAALRDAVPVALPYADSGEVAAAEAEAVGLRFNARRGERLVIESMLAGDSGALVFVDVFRVTADSLEPHRRVESADSGAQRLLFEPRRTAEYVVRMQPELLRGGRYTLRIRSEASLAFPVMGRGRGAVGSTFGDPRDGGRRDHHGIDIFAPRGTPVIAASAGYVSRVRDTPRGGKVIWMRDETRGLSLYYAHLDSQLVLSGAHVAVGDTLGLIGNTGNARTTPPHLHFGIYSRGEGPIDPVPFVIDRSGRP